MAMKIPNVPKKPSLGLEKVQNGWIEAFQDWNKYLDDPTGHANDTKAALVGKFFYLLGLNSPSRKITDAEIAALEYIIFSLDRVKNMSDNMRKISQIDNNSIVQMMTSNDCKPGVEFLKDIFQIDIVAPTLFTIDNPQLTNLDNVRDLQAVYAVVSLPGYDEGYTLPPKPRTFDEYATDESTYDPMPEGPANDPSADPPGDPGIGTDSDPSRDVIDGR